MMHPVFAALCDGIIPPTPLTLVRRVYPEAVVEYDRTAADCGYPRPWFVWSSDLDDTRRLGEGATEAAAITDALRNLE